MKSDGCNSRGVGGGGGGGGGNKKSRVTVDPRKRSIPALVKPLIGVYPSALCSGDDSVTPKTQNLMLRGTNCS